MAARQCWAYYHDQKKDIIGLVKGSSMGLLLVLPFPLEYQLPSPRVRSWNKSELASKEVLAG